MKAASLSLLCSDCVRQPSAAFLAHLEWSQPKCFILTHNTALATCPRCPAVTHQGPGSFPSLAHSGPFVSSEL